MNLQGIVSVVILVIGVLSIVVLITLGGLARNLLNDSVVSRLKYELPDGYKNDPNYQECYRTTKARFWEEYYIWNLTNLEDVLTGGKPSFNVVGPFAYTQWYCNYDHSIDKDAGLLKYRTTYEGYVFLPNDSISDDSVTITNLNPAYAGLLEEIGSESNLPILMYGPALETIIKTFQSSNTLLLVWLTGLPQILAGMNEVIATTITAKLVTKYWVNSTINGTAFFSPSFNVNGVQGWAYYTLTNVNASADVNLTVDAQNSIFATWSTNSTTLLYFATLNSSAIAEGFGVTLTQADYLSYYTLAYLLNPSSFDIQADVEDALAGQWANGGQPTFYSGWEIGIPTATGILASDVSLLFNSSYSCSLTNADGIKTWILVLKRVATLEQLCPGAYSLTPAQQSQVVSWLVSYATTIVNPYLLHKVFYLNDWNEFAYAQWGSLITNSSLGPAGGLNYAPEIAAFDYASVPEDITCVTYSVADAESLLNGTTGLFDITNMVTFFTLFSQAIEDPALFRTINSIWPVLNPDKCICLYYYLSRVIFPGALRPQIENAMAAGGSLFTTRTVREWLFTATDPLLALLGQNPNVAFVGNLTRSKAQADLLNYTYDRIYTGNNDLHWSLMPFREGAPLPFWRGDVRVTGFNGSQFLTHGYLDQSASDRKYPLELWNALINRSIPFENLGKDTWDGVHVRYLTMDSTALLSEDKNPDNFAYYSQYSGAINKTSNPPNLPLFLTTPNFLSAEPAFSANVTITDSIFSDYDPSVKLSRHRLALFILAEPLLGTALWGNLPIQVNLQYGPTPIFYPDVKPAFAPIYWNAIGNIATTHDLNQIKNKLYTGVIAWKVLIGVGAGFGTVCLIGGIVGLHHYLKHKNELKELPMTTVTTVSSST